jgi:peptide deformylase
MLLHSGTKADRGRIWEKCRDGADDPAISRSSPSHDGQRVVVFDEELRSLATDLLDTLRAASAIGITATHIGVLKRLAVIELAAAEGVRTYVNPQIVWASAAI